MTWKVLTARQTIVIRLVAAGHSNKEIATRMHISSAGVKKHLEALRRRYGIGSRTALIRAAIERGDLVVRRRRITK